MKLVRHPRSWVSMPISQAFATTITIAVAGPSSGRAETSNVVSFGCSTHVPGGFPVEHAGQVVGQQPFAAGTAATTRPARSGPASPAADPWNSGALTTAGDLVDQVRDDRHPPGVLEVAHGGPVGLGEGGVVPLVQGAVAGELRDRGQQLPLRRRGRRRPGSPGPARSCTSTGAGSSGSNRNGSAPNQRVSSAYSPSPPRSFLSTTTARRRRSISGRSTYTVLISEDFPAPIIPRTQTFGEVMVPAS